MKIMKRSITLALIFLLVFGVSGCRSSKGKDDSSSILDSIFRMEQSDSQKSKEQASFDEFLHQIFLNEVQNDSITLNYTLANPANYGIESASPSFGEFNLQNMNEELALYENNFKKIQTFYYKSLTKDQRLTYDILYKCLEEELKCQDYFYYLECLGPTTGIQAQLPVLLAEYNFYTKEDIDQYLALLPRVSEYFNDIIAFEQQKSKKGLFMSDPTAEDIIQQCKQFIDHPDDNYLIHIFSERIDAYEGLTAEEKQSYKVTNHDLILHSVIPAYEYLITNLETLKGTGTNSGGLSNFPKGKEYYEYLVSSTTGSSKTIKEIDELLDTTITKTQNELAAVIQKDPDSYYAALSPSFPLTDPSEIINYLKGGIAKDFPTMEDVECTIKYVDESLEDSLSPAFYLTPAIDNYQQNSIYINKGDTNDLSDIFTTIAHEGYPGHLYQSVYYNQQNPNPIRNVLNFGGYSEGWATYVELYSYHLSGLDPTVSSLLENNMIATLCVYGKVDIGVNYKGWTLQDTTKYLTDYGISDASAIQSIYSTMVAEPSNYMKYTLGYLEIEELKEKAQKALGDQFLLKDFHEFILKTGPAWFDVIHKYLDLWTEDKLHK